MADLSILQTIELSLTENLVPPVVHVRQYDSGSRTIVCSIYQDSVLFAVSEDMIVNISALKPDGNFFEYNSETDTEVVTISDNLVNIAITSYMTDTAGKIPVDVTLLDDSGASLGAFAFILQVSGASVENENVTAASYAGVLAAVAANIISCYIDDDGYLCIETDDGLELVISVDDDGNVTIEYGGES